MSRGRIPEDDLLRAGHRSAVGEGDALEVPPVDSRIISADPPDDLSPLASEAWRMCLPDMVTMGHLREPDLIQLRNFCVEIAIAVECEQSLEQFGAIMREPITAWSKEAEAYEVVGFKLKKNPAATLHREAAMAARLIAGELGLTILARIRGRLLVMATNSLALGVKDAIEDELDAEDAAIKKAKRTAAKKRSK